jgi:flagellar motor switch protein FliM
MIAVILADLSAAFDSLSSVNFRFDRLETNPRFETFARSAKARAVRRSLVQGEKAKKEAMDRVKDSIAERK